MAVYLFTFHTYRSWMPEHRRGYVRRKHGILPPDPNMGQNYARRARFDRVLLQAHHLPVALDAVRRVCDHPDRRDWRCYLAVAVFNHVHALVGWPGFYPVVQARAKLHRAINVDLRDALGLPAGRPALAKHGSRKRVHSRPHFDHLVHTYLPSHRKYGGVVLGNG